VIVWLWLVNCLEWLCIIRESSFWRWLIGMGWIVMWWDCCKIWISLIRRLGRNRVWLRMNSRLFYWIVFRNQIIHRIHLYWRQIMILRYLMNWSWKSFSQWAVRFNWWSRHKNNSLKRIRWRKRLRSNRSMILLIRKKRRNRIWMINSCYWNSIGRLIRLIRRNRMNLRISN
jgi:hypothetical protein